MFITISLVLFLGAHLSEAGGKGRYKAPSCFSGSKCFKRVGREKEVYGPVTMCMRDESWNDARRICADNNLRLCSAAEICRTKPHESNPDFKPWQGEVLTPINIEDEWLQIGDDESTIPLCTTTTEVFGPDSGGPEYGDQRRPQSWKQVVMCCPKLIIKTFYVSESLSWNQAVDFCESVSPHVKQNAPHYRAAHPELDEKDFYKLCPSSAICYDHTFPRWSSTFGEHYAPIIDYPNGWLHMEVNSGSEMPERDTCSTYKELNNGNQPSWGPDDVCPLEQKGLVYCCRDRRRVLKFHVHDEATENNDEKQADYYLEEDEEITNAREIGSVKVKTASDIAAKLKKVARTADTTTWTPYNQFEGVSL